MSSNLEQIVLKAIKEIHDFYEERDYCEERIENEYLAGGENTAAVQPEPTRDDRMWELLNCSSDRLFLRASVRLIFKWVYPGKVIAFDENFNELGIFVVSQSWGRAEIDVAVDAFCSGRVGGAWGFSPAA